MIQNFIIDSVVRDKKLIISILIHILLDVTASYLAWKGSSTLSAHAFKPFLIFSNT